MHPRCPVHVTELEESVCDGKTQLRAERGQPETAAIHAANTMMTNDSMPYVVISADPGIIIAQQYDFVVLQNSLEGGIQCVIKVMLLLLLSTPLHQRAASRVQHPNHVAANSLSPQVARKGSTLSGFVQRSRLEREVGRDLHSNKWEEV